MASKRELKKDIKEVIYDVVEEAYSFMLHHPKVQDEKVDVLIDDAATLMDELLYRVNNLPATDKKGVKEHFKLIKEELLKTVYELQVRVNQLTA